MVLNIFRWRPTEENKTIWRPIYHYNNTGFGDQKYMPLTHAPVEWQNIKNKTQFFTNHLFNTFYEIFYLTNFFFRRNRSRKNGRLFKDAIQHSRQGGKEMKAESINTFLSE